MLKVTEDQIRELAIEYGESIRYLTEVAEEAAADGEVVDKAYLRDFLKELYLGRKSRLLVMYREN